MEYLFKNVLLLDKFSPLYEKNVNLHIKNGVITQLTPSNIDVAVSENCEIFIENSAENNACVSVGWLDMRANFRELAEDFYSGQLSAQAGGFTEVCILPTISPPTQHSHLVKAITQQSNLVKLHAIGGLTLDNKGKELTDMIDLHFAGAKAFSDGEHAIWHTDILLKSLQYTQYFNGLVIQRPEDSYLNAFGQMHEGITSTKLGFKGMPRIAEEIIIQRDLEILKYVGGRLHFSLISTKKSVELIREAKKQGLNISCDICSHQLAFIDEILADFDTYHKVNPPFRENSDIEALKEGLQDGTIDVIVSDHQPHSLEQKQVEYDLAPFGIIGLETAFSVTKMYSGLNISQILDKIVYNPRKLLGLDFPKIAIGEKANITCFLPDEKWIFNKNTKKSKAENSPFFGKELNGKVLKTILG